MSLIYYPDPIFKQIADPITDFNQTLKQQIDIMFKVLHTHEAIGLGANMCGILKRIIIAPQENGTEFIAMINPKITEKSSELQTFEEASISMPGISAKVTRPQEIALTYQDIDQNNYTLVSWGFEATVIQHEIDYLDGITFLDHLPKGKSRMLKEKMFKFMKKMDRQDKNNDGPGNKCACC